MKIKLLFCLSLLFLISCSKATPNEDYMDERSYSVADESSYTVLMYDYGNSLILNILGSKQENPDMAAEILELEEKDSDRVIDAKLRWAFLQGNMNLLDVKEKTIEEIKAQNVFLLAGNYNLDRLNKSMAYFNAQVEETMDQLANKKGWNLETAVIYFHIFNPHVDFNLLDTNNPLPLVNDAISIAVSRFDAQKWHQKIYECTQKTINKHVDESPLIPCFEEYNKHVTAETNKVIGELQALKPYYERLRSVPDKSKMKKVEKDNAFIWKEIE